MTVFWLDRQVFNDDTLVCLRKVRYIASLLFGYLVKVLLSVRMIRKLM